MVKIHILGLSGSGKTTLAQQISSLLHVPHYDLDKIGMEKEFVTEKDAFEIAEQPMWISEGIYLIFTEPLLYQADVIVLLEIPWPVAAWRIIRRHIMNSLRGTNPYPGIDGLKGLYKLVNDTRVESSNKIPANATLVECMHAYLEEQRERVDPPTLASVGKDVEKYLAVSIPPTADFLHEYLKKYQEKVFFIRNNADRERLLEYLKQ